MFLNNNNNKKKLIIKIKSHDIYPQTDKDCTFVHIR